MTYLDQEREEKMNTMANPQPFRISRTQKLTLPTATTLLLGVVALFLLAATPRPAEALLPGQTQSLAPTLRVDKSSVYVSEEETATNTGGYDDLMDINADTVRVSASLGTVTQVGTMTGSWNWSYKAPSVTATETKTVTITARDSTGRYTTKSFSLTVTNVAPPVNDMFSGALGLKDPATTTNSSSTTTGHTTSATMEAGEPRPYSPTKDCGNTGHDKSVWFKFTYGGQGGFTPLPSPNASYNFDTQGSNFDSVLALYEGSSLGTLRQIECSNDNSLPNSNDKLSIPQSKLSVGKTYYVQLTGTGGDRYGDRYQLHYEPGGVSQPKVMTYNIAEGTHGYGTYDGLPDVARTIKALRPDIVLLNEIREYSGAETNPPHGVWNQTKYLANEASFPYFKYQPNTTMGINGTKGYAILSRYPISSTNYYEIEECELSKDILDPITPNWGILKATIEIDGLTHDVFSTRFAPLKQPGDSGYNDCLHPYNRQGHSLAMNLVQLVPNDHAVILGGDLNAPWVKKEWKIWGSDLIVDWTVPWAIEFRDNSGLTDVFVEKPDPLAGEDIAGRVDYIYYRGPYGVYQTQHRLSEALDGSWRASDHPYVFTHLLRDY
jgi:endonuclease/exonuclease/phosphatase family metal-dependent hydrolase